tara:strand:+ start:668 stop:943 length:276 start_codon:yes stop_codon:yes gene_type:complete
MSISLLRLLIRETIKQQDKPKERLIVEPDETPGEGEDEANMVGNIAGYTLPLGASNFPSSLEDRGRVAGKSFGGAKPLKKKSKKKKKKKKK